MSLDISLLLELQDRFECEGPYNYISVDTLKKTLGVDATTMVNSVKRLIAKDLLIGDRPSHGSFRALAVNPDKIKEIRALINVERARRLFLSHSDADKSLVREYKQTLEVLGFCPWLDEDQMTAGVELEKGIRSGVKNSCAAIFFVTPNFEDKGYLLSEINYAVEEQTKREGEFSIITLVFAQGDRKGLVPELLEKYAWKTPQSELQALQEIIKAIPDCYNQKQSTEGVSNNEIRPMDITWGEVQVAVEELKRHVGDEVVNRAISIDVIIGISHGGLIVADLLGKYYDGKIPVLGVPYSRIDSNITIPDKLFSLALYNKNVLLVDDCVISGKTMEAVIEYLNNVDEQNRPGVILPAVLGLHSDNRHRHKPEKLIHVYDINKLPYFFPWGQA